MADDTVQRFIDALRKLESHSEVDDLAGLYGEDAVCGNVATRTTHTGPDGAREFWAGYRKAFSEMRSDFREAVSGDAAAALEWVTTATRAGGDPVEYEGVTILEFDGDKLARSTAYFDPRAVVEAA